MKLLIYTPSVDAKNSIFGFMVNWLNEFRKQTDGLVVLSREVVVDGLAPDVTAYAVGFPWFKRIINIWKYAYRERDKYDTVFIHMTPQVAIVGCVLWAFLKKPVYLWYAHGAVPLTLRIAEKCVRKIFASSPSGLRLQTPKATFVGQGIDTDLFKPSVGQRRSELIAVSRVHPSKKYETTLGFLSRFAKKYPDDVWAYRIIGTSEGYESYAEGLRVRARELGLSDRFRINGPMVRTELPEVYATATAFMSTSETGSLDKVVMEALACGTPVFATGRGYQGLAGVMDLKDEDASTSKLHELLARPTTDFAAREGIIKDHSLPRLVRVLLGHMAV